MRIHYSTLISNKLLKLTQSLRLSFQVMEIIVYKLQTVPDLPLG